MSDLEIIKEVYDRVGICYVVKTVAIDNSLWSYLFLVNEDKRLSFEQAPLADLLRAQRFMEFKDGAIASY